MKLTDNWQALACSSELMPGENIVAGFYKGAELALWRSRDGKVQVWDNRCPHRSVRFTLGQVLGNTLSCAYHGWQFSADGGQCSGIPAHPHMAPPKGLCARVWPSAESAGMVWVGGEGGPASPPAEAVPAGWHFCRTLTVRRPLASLIQTLESEGWRAGEDACVHPSRPARALLLDAQAELAMAHIWTADAPGSPAMQVLHAELRRLRSLAEASA